MQEGKKERRQQPLTTLRLARRTHRKKMKSEKGGTNDTPLPLEEKHSRVSGSSSVEGGERRTRAETCGAGVQCSEEEEEKPTTPAVCDGKRLMLSQIDIRTKKAKD